MLKNVQSSMVGRVGHMRYNPFNTYTNHAVTETVWAILANLQLDFNRLDLFVPISHMLWDIMEMCGNVPSCDILDTLPT